MACVRQTADGGMAGVDHIDLVVSSLETSLPFYRGLLGPIGWRWVHEVEGERAETISYLFRRDGRGSIGVRERQTTGDGEHDRYSVGVHHVAIDAGSRRAIDRAAAWARDNGAEIESGPQEYAYQPGYYALFLHDPDGIKLELVTRPRLRTFLWALNPRTTPFKPENRGRPR
jgi:catechol 2,3-dioxygenase-like lactoylglutathione lyase family enzyme